MLCWFNSDCNPGSARFAQLQPSTITDPTGSNRSGFQSRPAKGWLSDEMDTSGDWWPVPVWPHKQRSLRTRMTLGSVARCRSNMRSVGKARVFGHSGSATGTYYPQPSLCVGRHQSSRVQSGTSAPEWINASGTSGGITASTHYAISRTIVAVCPLCCLF